MPISYGSRRGSSERTYQIAMDWTRRIMQLATLGTILLYAYLFYGLFMGDVGNWASLSHNDRLRIVSNIQGACMYLNVVLGVLLLTLCILYYDEESLGYMLVAGGVVLYYGLPFLLDQVLGNQLQAWSESHNLAALAIINQLKLAALMLAVPGGVLAIRDLILRVFTGSAHRREEFSAMQYGGSVHEEKPPSKPPVGILAKCWQLPYCRDVIRKGCPIYHARTKCWKERVGCMCEENVIRHAMDAIISKELIQKDEPDADDPLGGIGSLAITKEAPGESEALLEWEKTQEYPSRTAVAAPPAPRHVKIPHNPNVPMHVKVERCRNCVIYNEHQRLKYQFFAPLLVLAVPAVAFVELQTLSNWLNQLLSEVDRLLGKLSLSGGGGVAPDLAGSITSIGFANYVIIGCLVVILTTMALRFLEYVVFKLKL